MKKIIITFTLFFLIQNTHAFMGVMTEKQKQERRQKLIKMQESMAAENQQIQREMELEKEYKERNRQTVFKNSFSNAQMKNILNAENVINQEGAKVVIFKLPANQKNTLKGNPKVYKVVENGNTILAHFLFSNEELEKLIRAKVNQMQIDKKRNAVINLDKATKIVIKGPKGLLTTEKIEVNGPIANFGKSLLVFFNLKEAPILFESASINKNFIPNESDDKTSVKLEEHNEFKINNFFIDTSKFHNPLLKAFKIWIEKSYSGNIDTTLTQNEKKDSADLKAQIKIEKLFNIELDAELATKGNTIWENNDDTFPAWGINNLKAKLKFRDFERIFEEFVLYKYNEKIKRLNKKNKTRLKTLNKSNIAFAIVNELDKIIKKEDKENNIRFIQKEVDALKSFILDPGKIEIEMTANKEAKLLDELFGAASHSDNWTKFYSIIIKLNGKTFISSENPKSLLLLEFINGDLYL